MSAGRTYPLSRLGSELSAVINRVRRRFGPIPMADMACRPEILRAEHTVARVARQVARGECGLGEWRGALAEYEEVWMELLPGARRAEKNWHAA